MLTQIFFFFKFFCGIIIIGVRAQIGILGLGPYSRTWMRPRMNRWLGEAQNVESRKERMEGYSPRSLYSSDTKNINQADT